MADDERPTAPLGHRPYMKNWFFTLNNWAPEDRVVLDGLKERVEWLAYQAEVGKEGTPHLQGALCLKKKSTFQTMKLIHPRIHWEKTKGSPSQVYAYVTKERTRVEGPWTIGEPPSSGQGKRSDLSAVHDSVRNGASMIELCDSHFGAMVRHLTNIQRIRLFYLRPRDFQTRICIFYGDTGCGKTWSAENLFGPYYAPPHPSKNGEHSGRVWFDGYDPIDHPTIVFDEFDGSWFTFTHFLALTGSGSAKVELKGSTVEFRPKTLVITSKYPPETWYPKKRENGEYDQVWRRLDQGRGCIIHFMGERNDQFGHHPKERVLIRGSFPEEMRDPSPDNSEEE